MNTREIADAIKKYSTAQGVRFNSPAHYLRRLLTKEMGKNRIEDYDEIVERKQHGLATSTGQYAFFKTRQEVNLAFSFQSEVLLESSAWLATEFQDIAKGGWTVGELGCSVGLLTTWLAKKNTQASSSMDLMRLSTLLR